MMGKRRFRTLALDCIDKIPCCRASSIGPMLDSYSVAVSSNPSVVESKFPKGIGMILTSEFFECRAFAPSFSVACVVKNRSLVLVFSSSYIMSIVSVVARCSRGDVLTQRCLRLTIWRPELQH